LLNSCPVTGTTAAPSYFGAVFSLDGTTLSAAGHALLANAAAGAILQKYPDWHARLGARTKGQAMVAWPFPVTCAGEPVRRSIRPGSSRTSRSLR
jgi:hypothetical protein